MTKRDIPALAAIGFTVLNIILWFFLFIVPFGCSYTPKHSHIPWVATNPPVRVLPLPITNISSMAQEPALDGRCQLAAGKAFDRSQGG